MAVPSPPIVDKIPQIIKDWYIFIVLMIVVITFTLAVLKMARFI